jgi:hypothetical protein
VVAIPQGHGDLCDIPASHIFPLGVMKFRGVPVSVPGDVPGVLRYRYGDTFMIPRCAARGAWQRQRQRRAAGVCSCALV